MGFFDNLLHISVNLSPQNDPKNDLTSRKTREIPAKYPRKRGENNAQFTMHNAQYEKGERLKTKKDVSRHPNLFT